jgi:hypothetical protein
LIVFFSEYYYQSIAALFKSLTPYPDLLEPVVRYVPLTFNVHFISGVLTWKFSVNLTAGTPPTVLCSHVILAALSPSEDGDGLPSNVFHKLSLLRSVAKKVLDSVASEKPSISRPAREARELLRVLEDEEIEGVF